MSSGELKKKIIKEAPRFFRVPKGMHDVLPAEQPYWERIESAIGIRVAVANRSYVRGL